MANSIKNYVLKLQCHDHKGIVAKVSQFLFDQNTNIVCMDEYSSDLKGGEFFLRVEFCSEEGSSVAIDDIQKNFLSLGQELKANWRFFSQNDRLKMGILVSKPGHCLADLLYRWKSGDLPVEIPFVLSNHDVHRGLVEAYGIPYLVIEGKDDVLAKIQDKSDFLVLARYMQILSADFLKNCKQDVINIHHSFLPSFKGANPYAQAFERGVKVIGATAHFVTEQLDEGPIIEQEIARVTHRDSTETLKRKGKNLEKVALAQAIEKYVEHKVFKCDKKTIVF